VLVKESLVYGMASQLDKIVLEFRDSRLLDSREWMGNLFLVWMLIWIVPVSAGVERRLRLQPITRTLKAQKTPKVN